MATGTNGPTKKGTHRQSTLSDSDGFCSSRKVLWGWFIRGFFSSTPVYGKAARSMAFLKGNACNVFRKGILDETTSNGKRTLVKTPHELSPSTNQ